MTGVDEAFEHVEDEAQVLAPSRCRELGLAGRTVSEFTFESVDLVEQMFDVTEVLILVQNLHDVFGRILADDAPKSSRTTHDTPHFEQGSTGLGRGHVERLEEFALASDGLAGSEPAQELGGEHVAHQEV